MGKRKAAIGENDDDDDLPRPRRKGRLQAPEQYGPPKPWLHERKEYARRLQLILDALEISELGRYERMHLQCILWRADRLRQFDPKRFPARGDERVILLLRSIAETVNGIAALRVPILVAVESCLHDLWTGRGLEWLDAMDRVPLLEIHTTLQGFGLEDHLGRAIERKLIEILGPPVVAQPQTRPKKPARKTMVMPRDVSAAALGSGPRHSQGQKAAPKKGRSAGGTAGVAGGELPHDRVGALLADGHCSGNFLKYFQRIKGLQVGHYKLS